MTKSLHRDSSKTFVSKYTMRPLCTQCNAQPCAHNYTRDGVQHYRRYCESCRRRRQKLPPQKPLWQSGGYKKKTVCDLCGFHALYPGQTTVYHINGNLRDVAHSNLRTVCLNCIEVVKRREVNWRRGDLQVDR